MKKQWLPKKEPEKIMTYLKPSSNYLTTIFLLCHLFKFLQLYQGEEATEI